MTTGRTASDIAIQGSTAYLAGSFRSLGGITRNYLAAVNSETGQLLDWNPNPDSFVEAVAVRDNVVFAGGHFKTVGGQPRKKLAAIDARSGGTLGWVADAWLSNPSNGGVYALELSGNTLLVGGDFVLMGGEPRGGLAALDATSARVLPWDVAAGSGSTDYPLGTGIVSELSAYENTLYVGGFFRYMGTTPVKGLAAVSMGPVVTAVPTGAPVVQDERLRVFPNPLRGEGRIGFSVSRPSHVTLELFDVQGRRVESVVPHVPMVAGNYEMPFSVSGWQEGFYFCRLEVEGKVSIGKVLVLGQ